VIGGEEDGGLDVGMPEYSAELKYDDSSNGDEIPDDGSLGKRSVREPRIF